MLNKYDYERDIARNLHTFFGKEELDLQTLWTLVKLVKHVRLRCRSNAALNSTLSRMFPYARFEQVEKINPKTLERYTGLRIVVNNESVDDEAE